MLYLLPTTNKKIMKSNIKSILKTQLSPDLKAISDKVIENKRITERPAF